MTRHAQWLTLFILLGIWAGVAIWVMIGAPKPPQAPLAYVTGAPGMTVIAAAIVAAIVIERHRSNLARVMSGVERRLGQRT